MSDTPLTLWDLDSRNALGEFRTRDEALAYLRGVLDSLGRDGLRGLALEIDPAGPEPAAIMDDALVTMVERWRAFPASDARPDPGPSRRAGL
jgi:hypothetical protein